MNDTDEEMDTAVFEEEDWIEHMKRSTDEAIEHVTGYDSRWGYDRVGKFRDPELRKDGQPSTKVGLVSPGACLTFLSVCSRF